MISRKEITEKPVERLSALFSSMIRHEFYKELPEIVSTNRRYRKEGLDCCATHDHCDANMIMAAAFKQAMGYEPNLKGSSDVHLWNEAWKLSFDREFQAK